MDRLSGRWQIAYGVMIGLAVVACAGASFPFRHYGMDIPPECFDHGKLLGAKPQDDLPFSTCEPDAQDRFKCAVFQAAEFQRLKKSYLDLQAKLAECQRRSQ